MSMAVRAGMEVGEGVGVGVGKVGVGGLVSLSPIGDLHGMSGWNGRLRSLASRLTAARYTRLEHHNRHAK